MLGHLMLDLESLELSQEERELLQHPQVGGVILFSRNYHSLEQLHELIASLRSIPQKKFLIAVDQEGGRVQRFREGFTRIPTMRTFGKMYDQNPIEALTLTENTGWLMAAELRAWDIDLSFAPVLDLDHGVSTVIGDRSFHADPMIVSQLAKAFCRGMQKAGMASVGKHFPGHGAIAADSHIAMPIDERSYEAINTHDMLPFAELNDELSGIMPAHVVYPQIDTKPACFSKRWLTDILRGQLRFTGAIFSDDLSMEGAAGIGNYAERADQALAAGCDMILVCNHRQGAIEVLDSLKNYRQLESERRLLKIFGRAPVHSLQNLQRLPLWQKTTTLLQTVGIYAS